MTLTTHALGGAVAAALARQNPILAFIAGFLSHFALDAIPHRDYRLASQKTERDAAGTLVPDGFTFDRRFIRDLAVTGFDCAVGIGLSLAAPGTVSPATLQMVLIGALGGVVPDVLQFAYYLFPRSPLRFLQRFHRSVHTTHRLREHLLLGIVSQAAIAAALLFALLKFASY